ncbi:MAG TPA: UDP-N-acetylmuramoyl-tripeptide--D-alanyl-D-alanine ligase [Frankiaceae bacterium]|jgi:UDP-N-acetylmuramoyl-tripeptide--D-alanyl-D-alanine ligase|nr:UDP-N-acetylmuramoyl-tripeptide--D-alanyl-D-alanine ligase [Frankiaceae bacterium]
MIGLRLSDVANAVHGAVVPPEAADKVATGLVIDSRLVEPGLLFAALPGEHTDGHDHAAGAIAAGALAILGTRPASEPAIVVADVAAAMGALAAHALRQIPQVRVIGLTGSSGKTSTKDLVAALLEPAGPTIAPPGSYNNDLGVPLTALRADASTRFLVLEMGARGRGHIARLCAMAPPSIGVVLNVGSAHLGEFGSRQAIAESKGELAEAAGDVAVLNADDPLVLAMASRTRARVVTFGESPDAQVRAEDVDLDPEGRAGFTLVTPQGRARTRTRLALVGAHQVSNALAAAAVAVECGRTPSQVAQDLATAGPRSRWRMEVATTSSGLTVVNDAYNANPESMRAALKSLALMGKPASGRDARRTIAVLGPMYELGPTTVDEHDALGRLAVRLGVDKVVVVGADAAAIHTGARLEGAREEPVLAADVTAALAVLRDEISPDQAANTVVLVKASRAAGLERVAAALLTGAPEHAA